MSETGAFANMYEKYKEFCQLVDQVLLDIHMNRSSKRNPNRQKLTSLLKEISSKTNLSVDASWGELLLDDANYKIESVKELASVLSGDLNETEKCCQALEELAWLLESQRTKMYAKMRGSGF